MNRLLYLKSEYLWASSLVPDQRRPCKKYANIKRVYNIPRAYLLNSYGFKKTIDQACDITSEELVTGWDGYVANIQMMSRDMMKLQL